VPSHALTGSRARAANKARRRRSSGRVLRVLVALFPVVLFTSTMGNGSAEHASTGYYILGLLVVAAAVAAVAGLARAGRRFSQRYIRPTPRWLYLLFALCYGGPASVLLWLALEHPGGPHGADWAQMMAGLMSFTCAVAALIMIGRATARGDFRRVFYCFVPQWLGAWSAEAPGDPAGIPAGTGWDAEPRTIWRGRPGPPLPRSEVFRDPDRGDGPAR
jgi:hypothetical protein